MTDATLSANRENFGTWQDISTAPRDGTHVAILTKRGSLVLALWWPVEEGLDAWQAVEEGECPPSWTDGICWGLNDDEEPSDPPRLWTALPPSEPVPTGSEKKDG